MPFGECDQPGPPGGEQRAAADDQSARAGLHDFHERRLYLILGGGVKHDDPPLERATRFDCIGGHARAARVVGIDQHGNAATIGHQLVKELDALGDELLSAEKRYAGHVSAGPAEFADQALFDGVGPGDEDDRNGRRGSDRGFHGDTVANDNRSVSTDQIACERRQLFGLVVSETRLDDDVLVVEESHFVQAFLQRLSVWCGGAVQ